MKTKIVLIMCVLATGLTHAATDVSSYGSNPYLSWTLFPQDVASWQSNFISFFPTYEQRPYWGKIDQPEKKPNATYTSTGIKLSENGASFFHTAQIYSVTNGFGYTHKFPVQGIVANLNLNYDMDRRYNHADGNISDQNTGNTIPFNYTMSHTLNSLNLRGLFSFALFGMPAGLRVNGGFENTLDLTHKFEFDKNGTHYATDRATWGWTTTPCAHIFGAKGPEGDAWLQDGYAQGPVYNVDIQGGMSLSQAKIGALFSYKTGHQDYYNWVRDTVNVTSDAVINNNFIGSYQKDNWSRTIHDAQIQAFGNITWLKGERYSLNSFFLAGYEGDLEGEALSRNLGIEGSSKDKMHNLVIEAAPNISIPFGSIFSYIDAALRMEYSYSRFNHTYLRWVGGGQLETFRDTRTDTADETSWEDYSFANRNSLDFGINLSSMFPLFKNSVHNLGLGLMLLVDSRFTFMNKYYGQNFDQGSDVDFQVANIRKDFEQEFLFGTGLKLQYMGRPFLAWFEVTEPLLHSLSPSTRVTDASGGTVFYEHEKEPLWMSFEGLRAGLYVSYEWTLPLLRSF
jgi:hypothetical protein